MRNVLSDKAAVDSSFPWLEANQSYRKIKSLKFQGLGGLGLRVERNRVRFLLAVSIGHTESTTEGASDG